MRAARAVISGRGDDSGRAVDGGPPLTIGLFCPAWPPEQFANGIITYAVTMADALRKLGHRPIILTRTPAEGSETGNGLRVVDLKPLTRATGAVRVAEALAARLRAPSTETGIRRIARALRRVARGQVAELPRLDVLEIEETFGLAGAVARGASVPVVARMHGPWFLIGEHMGADPNASEFVRRVRFEGEGLREADGISAPSQDVLDRTASRYGLSPSEAEVIPNPQRPVPRDLRWRAEDAEADHVLFVGRFDRCKGGDTVIEAFARLLRDRPGARLTFVGPDPGLKRDGRSWNLPQFVEHLIPGAMEDGRVRWLGQRPLSEISGLRRRASATVVASRYETFALTATEAMAAGCPLVATRAGGAGELFEHGTHGLYADPEDPDCLASAISKLLADPGLAGSMGRRAAEHSERQFSPNVVAERTARLYRRMLAGRAGGRREGRP